MKVILVNGPPRAGKSTLARMLHREEPNSEVIGFSYHLKRMVHGIYLGRVGWDLDPDVFDAVKNEPQDQLSGMSWRETYIHYSEHVIKPLHGKEWFGSQFLRSAATSGKRFIFVPDSGFIEEAERVVRHVGSPNVLLIRLHREGCSFAGDSRSYIDLKMLNVPAFDIENVNGDEALLYENAVKLLGFKWP